MQIPVEHAPGEFVEVDLDPEVLSHICSAPSFRVALADAFTLRCRVPDVWRYTVHVRGGEVLQRVLAAEPSILSNYPDRPAADAAGSKTILLILTSPHKDEYVKKPNGQLAPKAPAQGRNWLGAGRAIHSYGHDVLRKLDLADGEYSLVIANPVPYQCSLSSVAPGYPAPLDPTVRDHVWRQLFRLKVIRRDFLDRCRRYRPQIILNCCTTPLRPELTDFICDNFLQEDGAEATLFESEHPAVHWCSLYKTGIPVYQVSLPDRIRTFR
jgi:hypothetical protein